MWSKPFARSSRIASSTSGAVAMSSSPAGATRTLSRSGTTSHRNGSGSGAGWVASWGTSTSLLAVPPPTMQGPMAKVWVLDTETKGTGAEVIPLEKALKRPSPSGEPFFVPPKPRPRPEAPPEPRRPRTFKVVDVMTQEVLSEGAGLRATLGVLEDVRSVVDVRISVWDPEQARWRLLTLPEQHALWEHRCAS
jgi:hypothetical protein